MSHNAQNAPAGEKALLGETYEESIQHSIALRNLAKVKATEQERLRQGWRYIRITPRTTLLLPCDRKGHPTKEAQQRIEYYKTKLHA